MPAGLCDTHTHTHFSFDGAKHATVDALCRAAIARGITDLAITDHCDVNGEQEGFYRLYDHAAAWEEMTAAKERYRGKLHLARGIELGQPHQYPDYAAEVLARHPYEFVIGSLHNLTDVPDFWVMDYTKLPPMQIRQLFDRALAETERLVEYPITTLGHLTYPHRYMALCGIEYDFSVHNSRIAALYEKMIRRDIALEVNVSPIWRGLGFSMPHRELLALYRDLGGRLITVGSDAHDPEHIGAGIRDGIALLASLGFETLTVVRNRERVFLPIT